MLGKRTIDTISTVQQMLEKYQMAGKKCMHFVDLEKSLFLKRGDLVGSEKRCDEKTNLCHDKNVQI